MIRYMLTNQLARQMMETRTFTPEFMFQLTEDEYDFLRCQIGTSNLEYDEKTDQFVLRSQIATSKYPIHPEGVERNIST